MQKFAGWIIFRGVRKTSQVQTGTSSLKLLSVVCDEARALVGGTEAVPSLGSLLCRLSTVLGLFLEGVQYARSVL